MYLLQYTCFQKRSSRDAEFNTANSNQWRILMFGGVRPPRLLKLRSAKLRVFPKLRVGRNRRGTSKETNPERRLYDTRWHGLHPLGCFWRWALKNGFKQYINTIGFCYCRIKEFDWRKVLVTFSPSPEDWDEGLWNRIQIVLVWCGSVLHSISPWCRYRLLILMEDNYAQRVVSCHQQTVFRAIGFHAVAGVIPPTLWVAKNTHGLCKIAAHQWDLSELNGKVERDVIWSNLLWWQRDDRCRLSR